MVATRQRGRTSISAPPTSKPNVDPHLATKERKAQAAEKSKRSKRKPKAVKPAQPKAAEPDSEHLTPQGRKAKRAIEAEIKAAWDIIAQCETEAAAMIVADEQRVEERAANLTKITARNRSPSNRLYALEATAQEGPKSPNNPIADIGMHGRVRGSGAARSSFNAVPTKRKQQASASVRKGAITATVYPPSPLKWLCSVCPKGTRRASPDAKVDFPEPKRNY
jgi:hypothetical protein